MIAAPGLSLNEWRGSVESVTGMPRRVDAASRCSALCHAAISRPLGAAPSRLKCDMSLPSTKSRADGVPKIGLASSRSPMAIIVWKRSPAFSWTVISARSSSMRSETGRLASSQGRSATGAWASVIVVMSVMSLLGVVGRRSFSGVALGCAVRSDITRNRPSGN